MTDSIELPATIKFNTSSEGIIEFEKDTAELIYDYLKSYGPPGSNPQDYNIESGIHNDARMYTCEVVTKVGNYKINFSNHGAMVIEYQIDFDGKTQNLIYPPNPAGRPHEPGDILRGGGLIAAPHNCEDVEQSELHNQDMNFHGILARCLTCPLVIDEGTGTFVFALSSNLIPESIPHADNILTIVSYKVHEDGSYTSSVQTFNFSDEIQYTNESFHPYFNTVDASPVGLFVGNEYIDIAHHISENFESGFKAARKLRRGIFKAVEKFMNSSKFPTLGLRTTKYYVELDLLKGFDIDKSFIGIWTNRLTKYFCLEALRHEDEPFDPRSSEKSLGYEAIQPGDNTTIAIKVRSRLI